MEPQALFDGGAIAPLGAPLAPYKDSGLALVMDALSGVLAGGPFGQDVPRGAASALLWALDLEAFLPREEFLARTNAQIDQVKQAEPVAGGPELTVPGERGARALRGARRAWDDAVGRSELTDRREVPRVARRCAAWASGRVTPPPLRAPTSRGVGRSGADIAADQSCG